MSIRRIIATSRALTGALIRCHEVVVPLGGRYPDVQQTPDRDRQAATPLSVSLKKLLKSNKKSRPRASSGITQYLGVKAVSYETEDVDIARGHLLALSDVPEGGLLEILKETGISFVEVPPMTRGATSSGRPPCPAGGTQAHGARTRRGVK
ncbi:hypothetical protein C0Z18_13575 [Trinickia dabaoshanensis]|uniref:Uncharacterized protein n=1 Tax=Trinickia dabaoshanensis TaxID=564714 RepID=A0A2N7VQC5_9BURK|nr:hypothetical protein C0Z18_13575 [Trinickia dabaoshanensis]